MGEGEGGQGRLFGILGPLCLCPGVFDRWGRDPQTFLGVPIDLACLDHLQTDVTVRLCYNVKYAMM